MSGRRKVLLKPPLSLRAARCAVVLLVLTGCGPPGSAPIPTSPATTAPVSPAGEPPPAVRRLLHLMRDRLALMHDVARSKWNSKRPVGDPRREQVLLRQVEVEGQGRGLDPLFTRRFFVAQIASARRVQEADCARWRAEGRGPFRDTLDLAVLRERIDGLNRELLGALAEARSELAGARVRERLRGWTQESVRGEGIPDDVCAVAVEPLTAP